MRFRMLPSLPTVLFLLMGGLLVSACTPKEAIPVSLSDARNRIESGLKIMKPEGAGPFPTILYFHGASDTSWYDEQEKILERFVKNGFAAVFVDMYHGRGVTGQAVRSGSLLPRATAGDVMIAVDWLSRQPWAAPGKTGVFGISFGAATIMDALVLDAPGRQPTSLTEKPQKGLQSIRAAAFLSPWCAGDVMGFNLIMAVHENFYTRPPTLAILPEDDTVSDPALCLSILKRNRQNGTPVQIIRVAGAVHTFAQRKDDYGNPFADFDAEKAERAWQQIIDFFNTKLK